MDDDGDDKDDTKRRTRNLSEKKRRDQFNMLVSELSNLITNNSRKMDKSSILKSTITYLKNYNEITVRSRAHDVQEDWKPAFLSNEEFTYLLLEALEAFVIVFSASGTIYYASDSILSLLGHKPEDVINTNIFDLTYEEDRPSLYNTLQKKATTTEPSGYNTSKENETMKFQIHIRRGPLNRAFSYDLVQFYGHSRAQHDKIDDERDLMDFEPRVLFVCIGRLHKPLLLRDVSLVDTSQNEFTSRHSLEWKFLFLDHRAPPIIGYLPFEVLGTSGYDYYHFDDLEKVVTCHEALMEKGELTSCHYRFLTKGQQWIWLQSRFYITYHQWNSKPEFVVCTHRVVSYDDVVETKEESVEQERTSETEANSNNMNETPADDLMPMSPSYLAKPVNESYDNSDQSTSQPASVKFVSASSTASTTDTVATTGASWPQVHNHYHDADGGVCSEAALLSEEASITHRNSAPESHELPESSVAVQYSIGTHYIDPVLYGSGALVSPSMMSAMPAPDIQDQAQIQLQRKHEELQQMIVRQQEELRRVKEQLLLARLGMLQPIVNVPSSYTTPEEMPNQQRGTAELVFPNAVQPMGEYAQVPVATITLQPPQSHLTHTLQHATHPTHSPHLPPPPEQQQNMPQ